MELGNILFGHSRGEYHIEPREQYQNAFFDEFALKAGLDGYGRPTTAKTLEKLTTTEDGIGYENDTFIIRPYYWGDEEMLMDLPNFVYKPTGLTIRWYKYPMRDAYASEDISVEAFKEICRNCLESLNGKRRAQMNENPAAKTAENRTLEETYELGTIMERIVLENQEALEELGK